MTTTMTMTLSIVQCITVWCMVPAVPGTSIGMRNVIRKIAIFHGKVSGSRAKSRTCTTLSGAILILTTATVPVCTAHDQTSSSLNRSKASMSSRTNYHSHALTKLFIYCTLITSYLKRTNVLHNQPPLIKAIIHSQLQQ